MDKTRHWQIVGCSAYTGEGLLKGFDWLVQDIASRIYMLDWEWEWYMDCVTIWQDKIFDKIPIVQAILRMLWELDHRYFNQRWWHLYIFFSLIFVQQTMVPSSWHLSKMAFSIFLYLLWRWYHDNERLVLCVVFLKLVPKVYLDESSGIYLTKLCITHYINPYNVASHYALYTKGFLMSIHHL